MAKGIWIKADGTNVAVEPDNGKTFELDQLQKLVDGYIEIVRIDAKRLMVVNEEGAINGLPINKPASILARQMIVGNVLVTDSKLIK